MYLELESVFLKICKIIVANQYKTPPSLSAEINDLGRIILQGNLTRRFGK